MPHPARHPGPVPAALVAALLAATAAGCGGDQADRAQRDRIAAACQAAVGRPLGEAAASLRADGGLVVPRCPGVSSPLPSGDACPGAPGPYTEPVCLVGYEYCARGTSLCTGGPLGGCAYACVVRVVAASTSEVTNASVICASAFVSGQPFGPVSGLTCQ